MKRLRDHNDKARHLTQLPRKARKVRLSVSDTPQDSHPISLERVEDPSSLVTCLEDSRINLRPPGSSNSEHPRPLAALSFLGARRAVREIVENAAEVHVTEEIIGESLKCASWQGDKAVVRVLLDAGARLNRAGVIDDSSLRKALWGATVRGHTKVIELLISKGAIAKRLDYSFYSRVAARQGKIHMVKLFLDSTTTNINKMESFYGALQAAIIAKQSSIVQYLMGRSAEIDITAREDLYFATLRTAFFERDDSTVQFLISRAFGPRATNIRRAKLKVLDTSCTPRTKLVILQILGAGIDHPLLERNHERDYIPIGDAYWENAVEIEDTIKETLLEERKLLEE